MSEWFSNELAMWLNWVMLCKEFRFIYMNKIKIKDDDNVRNESLVTETTFYIKYSLILISYIWFKPIAGSETITYMISLSSKEKRIKFVLYLSLIAEIWAQCWELSRPMKDSVSWSYKGWSDQDVVYVLNQREVIGIE